MNSKRLGRVKVSYELLESLLRLNGTGTKITRTLVVNGANNNSYAEFIIEGPNLRLVPEGRQIPIYDYIEGQEHSFEF